MIRIRIKIWCLLSTIGCVLSCIGFAQRRAPELLGLSGKKATAISIREPYLYAATDSSGVYTKNLNVSDTQWNCLGLLAKRLTAIYAYSCVGDSGCKVLVGTNPTGVNDDTVLVFASVRSDGNWTIADSGIQGEFVVRGLDGFPDSLQQGKKFAAMICGLYRLEGGIFSWKKVYTRCGQSIRANQKHNVVWAGGQTDAFGLEVSISQDGGETWREIELPIPANYGVLSLATSDSNPAICLAGAVDVVGATLDTGNTWKAILSELDVGFFGVAVDPADAGHFWAGGLKNGVGNSARLYESTDTGKSWLLLDAFTDQPGIREMTTSSERGVVYLATNSGVYRYGRKSASVGYDRFAVPQGFALYQNYPNPFNPSTTIEFDVPTEGYVRLRVFDILGQEISTLVNDIRLPGHYRVTWDAAGLGSAIYFYRLSGDNFVDTKPMVVIR